MLLAHFSGNDTASAALTFGVAFVFLAWRQWVRGNRTRATRIAVLAVVALAVGIASGLWQ